MVKTVMIGLTCATALLLTDVASAQLGGFGLNDQGLYDSPSRRYEYERKSDAQIMEESLYPYGRNDAEQQRLARELPPAGPLGRRDRLLDDGPQPGRAAALSGQPPLSDPCVLYSWPSW